MEELFNGRVYIIDEFERFEKKDLSERKVMTYGYQNGEDKFLENLLFDFRSMMIRF